MNLIDRQIEVIAGACAVSTATVRAVIAGQRVGDGPDARVRAALSLIGFVPPLPSRVQTVGGARERTVNGVPGIEFHDPAPSLFVDPAEQAFISMRLNGNGPECLPHLACGGCGCDGCIGGALRCGVCVHRCAVTTAEDGTPEKMPVCGWCAAVESAPSVAEGRV